MNEMKLRFLQLIALHQNALCDLGVNFRKTMEGIALFSGGELKPFFNNFHYNFALSLYSILYLLHFCVTLLV